MSLRTRVAIAVGVVVFGALAVVAAVIYPAVGANLRGQNDESLVQVAKEAPTIAAKLKQARTPPWAAGPIRQHPAADPARFHVRTYGRVRGHHRS